MIQFTLTIENAVPEAKDMDTRGVLFQQALALADFILNGYSCQLDSIREQREEGQTERLDQVLRKYQEDRQALLQPFSMYCYDLIRLIPKFSSKFNISQEFFGLMLEVEIFALFCLRMILLLGPES